MKQINKFATSSCIKTTECQNYDMIGVMTNSRLLIEEAMESKGGIDMCTALEQLEKPVRPWHGTPGNCGNSR